MPTFSVGEYDWDKPDEQRGWVWHTATVAGRLDTASSVFDFMTMFQRQSIRQLHSRNIQT